MTAALSGGGCGGKHSRESSGAPGLTPKEIIGKTASFNASYRLAAELSKMSAKSRKQALLGMQKNSGRSSGTLLKPSASSGLLVSNQSPYQPAGGGHRKQASTRQMNR